MKQMDIISFSLCYLFKLATHVVDAKPECVEKGEKICVFYILSFGTLHLYLAEIYTCFNKYPFCRLLKSLRENIGVVVIYINVSGNSAAFCHIFVLILSHIFPAN